MPLHEEVTISLVCSAHSASGGRVAGSNPASPTKLKSVYFRLTFFMPLHGEVSISLVCSEHSASGGRVAGSNPASPTKLKSVYF